MIDTLLDDAKRLKAIAETGLIYCKNDYDIDRYNELLEIAYRMIARLAEQPIEQVKVLLPQSADYPTAKVDIRCFILSESNEVLLVRESIDGKWSLPGGWADIGYSPKETAKKEAKEETGLDVVVDRLVAVMDKRMHDHPQEPYYIYKMFFHCKPVTTILNKGFDVLDVQYFSIDALPELSEDRILRSQIELVFQKVVQADLLPYCD